jgi:hypothetical protein
MDLFMLEFYRIKKLEMPGNGYERILKGFDSACCKPKYMFVILIIDFWG